MLFHVIVCYETTGYDRLSRKDGDIGILPSAPPVFKKSGLGRIFFRLGKPFAAQPSEPEGEDCHGEIRGADEAGQPRIALCSTVDPFPDFILGKHSYE